VQSIINVPKDVKIRIKEKTIYTKGINGELSKKFNNKNVNIIYKKNDSNSLIVRCYYNNKSSSAIVRTITSIIYNMIIGVSKGFTYLLKIVYSHFPISVKYIQNENTLEITNLFGLKRIDSFFIPSSVQVCTNNLNKKEIILLSKDIETLGILSSLIQNKCSINNKDCRVFIDGIYLASKEVNSLI